MTVAFTTSLDGWFKNVYAASWEDAVPEWAIAAQLIPFGNQERLGKQYNFPVLLRRSHGDTFTGTTGAAVTLNDAVSMVMDEATVQGSGYVLQEDVTYETLSRAAAGGKAAFGDVMEVIVGSMRSTTDYKRELALLYGNSTGVAPWDIGIGTTTTIVAAAASIGFVVTEASWASGIWAQSEGMFVDMYNGVTLQNASPQTLQVAAVNHATRTVTLKPHPMQMQGFAPIIVPSQWKRRGSTDTTFRLPGVGDGKAEPAMWMPLESKQAVRFRSFWDQCLICTKPSSQVLGTGIVNNT